MVDEPPKPRRGSVDRSQVRHLKQHELDTARRLANRGFIVVFRQADEESTADAHVNGVRTDFKSSSSDNIRNIRRQITKRRSKQGPCYVLDITASSLVAGQVTAAMQRLCEEFAEEIASIMVVGERGATTVIEMAGKEVPEWRM
jgi:Contact-dependent growth inhibition CdiA C-terminal domain